VEIYTTGNYATRKASLNYVIINWIGVLGFDYWRGLEIFLFTTAFRTELGPTQHPIQWVPGAVSLGIKRPEREAHHSPPSSADVKEYVALYLHSTNTLLWHGAQFKISTVPTLLVLYFKVPGNISV
jgi:hypothetical protein